MGALGTSRVRREVDGAAARGDPVRADESRPGLLHAGSSRPVRHARVDGIEPRAAQAWPAS